MSPQCLPLSFSLIRFTPQEQNVVSRFSRWPHGGHLGYWILERNKFSNSKSPCHPNASHQVWAQSKLPFGGRHGLTIFKMATGQPSLISEQHDFSNSESLCCSDASYQVLAPSDLRFGRCSLKTFKMADMAVILDIRTE